MSVPFDHVVHRVIPAGDWTGGPHDRVTLDYEDRFRRRIVLTCDGGIRVLLDLPEARLLNHGDALVTETGTLFQIRAKPEALLEIRGRDRHHLLRLAWHLGNRHLPTEIADDHLRIRADHVIAEMLRGLGADVRPLEAPFNPEGGAYGPKQASGHAHDH